MMIIFAILICFIAGICSGLLGIGGGLILVPLFHYILKMNMHQAVGTSLALIVPTALFGAFRHSMAGNINWHVIALACIFAIAGGYVGASLSVNIDVATLRKAFAVFMIAAAIKMFFQ